MPLTFSIGELARDSASSDEQGYLTDAERADDKELQAGVQDFVVALHEVSDPDI